MSFFMRSAVRTAVPLAALLTGFALATPAAHAQLVVNGDFETPVIGSGFATYGSGGEPTDFGWSVLSGSVDHISSAFWQGNPGQSLDMSGTSAGSIAQNINTVAGQSYLLNFSLAGNPSGDVKQLQVFWGNVSQGIFTFDTAGKTTTNMGWVNNQLTVQAQGTSTQLRFTSLTAGNAGPALDSVSLTAVGSVAAPEPSALALLTPALPFAALVLRRRKPRA